MHLLRGQTTVTTFIDDDQESKSQLFSQWGKYQHTISSAETVSKVTNSSHMPILTK